LREKQLAADPRAESRSMMQTTLLELSAACSKVALTPLTTGIGTIHAGAKPSNPSVTAVMLSHNCVVPRTGSSLSVTTKTTLSIDGLRTETARPRNGTLEWVEI
jgi:hypothetical protein